MSEKIFLRDDATITSVIEQLANLWYAPTYFHEQESFPFEIDFRSKDQVNTFVHCIQNKQLKINYLNIVGPDAPVLRQDLEKVLSHYDRKTTYERASTEQDLSERVKALYHLALGRLPVPEPDVLRLLGEFLVHSDERVRQCGVLSIAYFEWPEALSMLDDLIGREKDATVLGQAQLLSKQARARPQPTPITGFERLQVRSGSQSETVWGEKWLDGRYVVSSIPQVTYNLSLGDPVQVEMQDGALVIVQRKRSGHRTVRLNIGGDREKELSQLVRAHRGRVELQQPERAALDLPPYVDSQKLLDALTNHGYSPEVTDPQPSKPNVGPNA